MQSVVQVLILGLLTGGILALLSSGLTLLFGVMRIINLAHGAFILGAAYLAWVLYRRIGLDPLLSIPLSVPLFFLLGVLLWRGMFRRLTYPGATVLLTFGLAFILEGYFAQQFTATQKLIPVPYGRQSLLLAGFIIPKARLLGALTSMVVLGLFYLVLYRTGIGRAIRATMQNRQAAQLVGINVDQVSAVSLGLGMATAAVGGAMFSFISSFAPATHWVYISQLLSIIVLGGMGSLRGAFAASLLVGVGFAMAAVFWSLAWAPSVFYLTLLVVLVVRPQGLFGEFTREETF